MKKQILFTESEIKNKELKQKVLKLKTKGEKRKEELVELKGAYL